MKYFNSFSEIYSIANSFSAQNNLAQKANQEKLVEVVRNNLAMMPSLQIGIACAQWDRSVVAGGTIAPIVVGRDQRRV